MFINNETDSHRNEGKQKRERERGRVGGRQAGRHFWLIDFRHKFQDIVMG